MPDALQTALTENDNLRLNLLREKSARMTAELVNLQMAVGQRKAQMDAADAENKVFLDKLKVAYALAPADEISEDGTIKRSPVRALKEG